MIKKISLLSFIFLFLLLAVTNSAQGQEKVPGKSDLKNSVTKSIKKANEPKKELKGTSNYLDPAEYPLKNEGDEIGTLWDSVEGWHYFIFDEIANHSGTDMNLKVTYYSENSYYKDSIVTLEVFREKQGALSFEGYVNYDTYGNNYIGFNTLMSKALFSDQKYIYVRLGISESDYSEYYSDAVQFKVANPYYTAPPSGQSGYLVISNESTDGYESQSTGTFRINNDKYTFSKNLKPEAYKLDVRREFNVKKHSNKLINKSKTFTAQAYQVGAKRNFWVYNFATGYDESINAELLYTGSKVNVWVHNSQINSQEAKKLGDEFDNKIYSAVVNNFANESDVDKDGKINVLCYDIQDGYSYGGGYIAGYFYAGDLYDVSYSNKSEIFYIDTYPAMGWDSAKDVTLAYTTLAHEFQHLVNHNQNVIIEDTYTGMDAWLNEALAMAAEQIYSGQALTDRIQYYNYSESVANGHSLLFWDYDGDTLANYSLSYLFGQYVKLQANQGDKIFKEIMKDSKNDYGAIENAVKKYIDSSLSFGKFMTRFRIALLLRKASGPEGFKGEEAFDSLENRLYSGSETNLRGGGALVKEAYSENVSIPADKGANITYTFVGGDGAVDITPPAKPSVNAVSDKDTAVTGKTEAKAKIYVKSGNTTLGSGTANSSGSFSIAIKKQKAGTKLTVYAEDSAGNKSPAVTLTVIDKTPPSAPGVSQVADNHTKVSGTAEASSKVVIMAGNKTLAQGSANSSGKFSVSIKKQKAGSILYVYAVDKAGNMSSKVKKVVADKTAPSAPSVNTVSYKTKTVTGKAEKGATVYVYAGKKLLGKSISSSKGNYKVKIKAQKRGTVLKLYAKDKAGNKSKAKTIKVK